MSLDQVRVVADAVLYEGYLLYPYRSTSSKNQSRWQWGVLGPPGAAEAGFGEESAMSTQCLLRPRAGGRIQVRLRFLQLQTRTVEQVAPDDPAGFAPLAELRAGSHTWTSWDEAVPHEVVLDAYPLSELRDGRCFPIHVPAGEDVELLHDPDGGVIGRLVRRRWPLAAEVSVTATTVDGLVRLETIVHNHAEPVANKEQSIRASFIGAHLILSSEHAEFVSLIDPPEDAGVAAATCRQQRCWPVLAGMPGQTDIVLACPIILYDYPEVAEQSAGALFDSTEIDEILTLRVMTLTDEEKAAARATDPRAAEIIDRCEQMSPDGMRALHGTLRDPHADLREVDPPSFDTGGTPWWDPAEDASVQPETDSVMINGIPVSKDSLVRIHPSRRADAQDIFFADQTARVTAVLSDVDGQIHVAVVLVDDPAADMHEWYGRFMYFAPDELEPLGLREESRS